MKRFLSIVAAAALALSGCTTPGPLPAGTNPVVTPARCAAVLQGATTAGQIVDMLASLGIARVKAQAIALLLSAGKRTTAEICGLLNPGALTVKPLPEHPRELSPPPASP